MPGGDRGAGGVGVQPGVVGRVLPRAEQFLLERVRVGQHAERLVGVGGDHDRVERWRRAVSSRSVDPVAVPGHRDDRRRWIRSAYGAVRGDGRTRLPPTTVRQGWWVVTPSSPWLSKNCSSVWSGKPRSPGSGGPDRRRHRQQVVIGRRARTPASRRKSPIGTSRVRGSSTRRRPEPVEPDDVGDHAQVGRIRQSPGCATMPRALPAYSRSHRSHRSDHDMSEGWVGDPELVEQAGEQRVGGFVVDDEPRVDPQRDATGHPGREVDGVGVSRRSDRRARTRGRRAAARAARLRPTRRCRSRRPRCAPWSPPARPRRREAPVSAPPSRQAFTPGMPRPSLQACPGVGLWATPRARWSQAGAPVESVAAPVFPWWCQHHRPTAPACDVPVSVRPGRRRTPPGERPRA
jgi:hypothetical protein